MLTPKKIKHRKHQKGRLKGAATSGTEVSFGEYGLQAVENGMLTTRQIEAARIAISRFVKRGGKIWIRIFPDKPLTAKPAETRMGSGKGSPVDWVCPIHRGRMLYEIEGISIDEAKEAFRLAANKLPIKSRFVMREGE